MFIAVVFKIKSLQTRICTSIIKLAMFNWQFYLAAHGVINAGKLLVNYESERENEIPVSQNRPERCFNMFFFHVLNFTVWLLRP